MTGKEILQALGLLSKADPKDVDEALAALGKAEPHPEGAPRIESQFDPGKKHAVPSREAILTGPGQSASGSGAERMIREYSSPAPQKGVEVDAEKLESMLEDFRGYVGKAQALIGKLGEALLAKAKEEEDGEKDEDDEEVAEKCVGRARRLIEKAKKLVAKAEEKEEEEEEEHEEKKARELKLEARKLRKRAGRLLGEAHLAAFAARGSQKGRSEGAELIKAVRQAALKGDVDVIIKADDEEDDEEEDGKGKGRTGAGAAAKNEGTDNDKGNQKPGANSEGNQDDAAAKALAELKGQIEAAAAAAKSNSDALQGLTVLQGNLQTLMDAMAGKTNPGGNGAGGQKPGDFAFIKGDPTVALDQLALNVEEAIDAGRLTTWDAIRARDILQKVTAVHAGVIHKSVVDELIAQSNGPVQALFPKAA